MFKALKLTVDFKEIVFNDVLPKLSKYKNKSIVGVLAKYCESFKSKLESNDTKATTYLNELQLLCHDGEYRTPKDVVVSGQYFDVEQNVFSDIQINKLLSEEYLSDCGTDSEKRREITKFIKLIADNLGNKCENATQLRDLKLKYFCQHQDFYAQTEAHYRIIGELAKAYNSDTVGLLELIKIWETSISLPQQVSSKGVVNNTSVPYITRTASTWLMGLQNWISSARSIMSTIQMV